MTQRCSDWYCKNEAVVEGFCQECYDDLKDYRCPLCGAICTYDGTCPTYPSTYNGLKVWMACHPCSNATEWTCSNDDCDWFYVAYTQNPTMNTYEPTPWSVDIMNEGFHG